MIEEVSNAYCVRDKLRYLLQLQNKTSAHQIELKWILVEAKVTSDWLIDWLIDW